MGRIRLILADDEAPVLEAMCELVSTDHRIDVVGTARDANEAIDLAQRHAPDVALLDVRMPGGGGSRAAREIRRRSPATRILALSATTDPRTVVSMVRAGAVGYVGKDQPADEVLRAIHRSADGRASMSVDRLGEVAERLAECQTRRGVDTIEPALVSADRIREAIHGDAIETVFQPIVDLDDGRVRGVEALSRFMTRPRRSPETWFAEAARYGLLTELELAAAQKALGHMHLVPDGIYVSVNASAETMCAPELAGLLQRVPAHRVVLELTECSPIRDRQDMARSLGTLRTLGARLALDDVGKGFSALGNVLEFSPDFLKFDRTLVSGVDTDITKRALIHRLTAFGDEVGVEVVAEGIESASEVETLRAVGVRNGQGFLLGRPGPIPPRTSEDLTWPGSHGPSLSPADEGVRTPA
jgi:EAL domain-containing protein (putative c-di-GMP-specific phosphodiesterase class I)/DNA-binding NarL/FixJ family response regulator